MLEFLQTGGWLMWPILACSVVSVAIILERLWSLRRGRVLPADLLTEVRFLAESGQIDARKLKELVDGSPLGRILAAGLGKRAQGHGAAKESIEDCGRHVIHDLERYLNSLGTVAAITPLLGLLGTVIGMIRVFNVIASEGVGDPSVLSGGISEALITTAAGLTVAIPSLMFFRYFRGRVEEYVVHMEQASLALLDSLAEGSAPGANTGEGS